MLLRGKVIENFFKKNYIHFLMDWVKAICVGTGITTHLSQVIIPEINSFEF